jgi:hypothetical protein
MSTVKALADQLGVTVGLLRRVAGSVGRRYRPFDIRRGTGWRHIDNPVGDLRLIQRSIHRVILANAALDLRVIGFVPGGSTVRNALPHVGMSVVATIDIRSCFPSIDPKAVYAVFADVLRWSAEAAAILTQLTTYQHRLPQGAATSPMIANLVLAPLHEQIISVAERRGLECSFYADDITLSGPGADVAIGEVIAVVRQFGFQVSWRKVRVMRAGETQVVTGIVVNEAPSAGRQRTSEIRQEIYQLGCAKSVYDRELRSVRGKIEYVRSVNPAQGESLAHYAERWLPRVGEPGQVKQRETRPCRHTRRHERSKRRPKRTRKGQR